MFEMKYEDRMVWNIFTCQIRSTKKVEITEKSIHIKKEEIKLYLFADDMNFYVENFKEFMKKYLLELISEFSMVVGIRSTYKNQLYFYILVMNV